MSLLLLLQNAGGSPSTDADAGLASASGAAHAASVTTGNPPVWTTPGDGVSITSTPTLAFTIPALGVPMHFEMQLDQAGTFDTGLLRIYRTNEDQTGWEYYDGGTWQAFPSGGVDDAYAGNEARYTVSTALASGTWHTRVRAGI